MRKFDIKAPNKEIQNEIQRKIDNLNKPKDSLGRLESLALQICLIQQTLSPYLNHPCHLLFGADHGIEREGVSVSPRQVTWQQMINFTKGGGGVNMFCRQHGFRLYIVDVGVDYDLSAIPEIKNCKIANGTANFLYGEAMSKSQFDMAVDIGIKYVDGCYADDCNIISIGEMGIANTSPSSIWMYFFGNVPIDVCIGAGAGLDKAGIMHKQKVLSAAIRNFLSKHNTDDTETIIRYFGGFEMVSSVSAMLRAAEHRMVILIDGFIMSACALAASKLYPDIIEYMVFGHQGDENGHKKLLELLNAKPLLNLGLKLGEGTGALCAFPIVDSAVRMMNEMDSFENANITKYF